MPPLVIYRNLRLHRGMRVRDETIRNYLSELADEGLVLRVEKAELDDGDLVEADPDDRAYYIISEKGREYLRN